MHEDTWHGLGCHLYTIGLGCVYTVSTNYSYYYYYITINAIIIIDVTDLVMTYLWLSALHMERSKFRKMIVTITMKKFLHRIYLHILSVHIIVLFESMKIT